MWRRCWTASISGIPPAANAGVFIRDKTLMPDLVQGEKERWEDPSRSGFVHL
jgi:hypothetical protein